MSGTFIIIGATSGLAKAFARKAAAQQYRLVLAGRDMTELEILAADLRLRGAPVVTPLAYDAADPQAALDLLALAKQLDGPISLYWAAGLMPDEAAMRMDPALCQQMIATNYTGAVLATNALLPLFETQRSGHVILIGSVAGDRGRKKNHLYGASKAGLQAYAEGVGALLSSHQVPVLLVKPGVMDTAMTWGIPGPPLPMGAPEALAEACWKKMRSGGTLYFPWFWWGIMMIIRHLPRKIFNRLNF